MCVCVCVKSCSVFLGPTVSFSILVSGPRTCNHSPLIHTYIHTYIRTYIWGACIVIEELYTELILVVLLLV